MCIFFVLIIGSIINSRFAKSKKKSENVKIDDLDKNNFEINIPLLNLVNLRNKRFYNT